MGVSIVAILLSAVTTKLLADMLIQMAAEDGAVIEESALSLGGNGLGMIKSAFGNGMMSIVTAILVTLLVVEDYTGDIIKNIYAKGYSRDKVFFAKYISTLVAVLISLFVNMLVSFLLGIAMFDGVGSMGQNYIASVLAIMFIVIAFHAMYFMIGMLIKKTGGAIALNILAPSIISLLFTLADTFIKKENFSFSDYWLTGLLTSCSATDVGSKPIILSFVISIVLTLALGSITFIVNKKRDN